MRHLLPIALNQLTLVGLGVVGVKLISEFVPTDVNGRYALFVTLTQLGFLIAFPDVINHAARYWQRESGDSGVYARFLWSTVWKGLRIWAPGLVALSALLAWYYGEIIWLWAAPALVVSNLGVALHYIANGALTAARRQWQVLTVTFVATAARVLLPIAVALLFGVGFLTLTWGYLVHGLVVVTTVLIVFHWAWRSPVAAPVQQEKWVNELKEYGRPFVLMGIGGWLLMSADRWVVKQFFDDHQAGLFAFASSLGAIVPTMALGGLMQLVVARAFKKADTATTEAEWRQIAWRCDQVTLLFLGVSLGGLAALHWSGPYLVGWLISERYEEALPMIVPAGVAMMTALVNQFYYLLLQGQHNSAAMVRVMIVVAGVKTIGSIAAAAISFVAFRNWLVISLLLGGLIGRFMIRRTALRLAAESAAAPAEVERHSRKFEIQKE